MDAHDFLIALTIVLGVAAVTTIVFQRLRQPVLLGYVLAGLIIGPHVSVPLVADPAIVRTLSELGVILVMFSLGLEFSLGKLARLGRTAGFTALLESSLMVWLGFVAGRLLGWSMLESLFTGAIVAISSTTIITKAFEEQGVRGATREFVIGVLVVEDLIAILLMATLTAIASGAGLSAAEMALTTSRLLAFLVALISIGLLVVPRSVRAINRLGREETTLVAAIGFCFGVSLLAHAFGYTVALGAFIAGSLVAESGEEKIVERLVRPVRDMFAAIFFVSVGMLIDPALIARHWSAVAVLSGVVVFGKLMGVSVGAFLTGSGVRTAVQSGMSLTQIGEFSFIIAGLGLSLGATGEFLYPVAVAVSAITTLTTPWLIRASGPAANFIDRKLPRPLQTFAVLYASWFEQLRRGSDQTTRDDRVRRLVKLLLLDVAILGVLVIGASLGFPRMTAFLGGLLGWGAGVARPAIVAGVGALALPLVAGVVRVAQQLGLVLAESALPKVGEGRLDLSVAPRRALVVTLQLAIVLVTGLPILAVTQPILGGFIGPGLFLVVLSVLGVSFWRGATELQGHVRAGAQAIVEALLDQARRGVVVAKRSAPGADPARPADPADPADALQRVHEVLPGLGELKPVRIDAASPAVGRSLTELNLRGMTGATVLVITRGEVGLMAPTATEVLQAGDVLALAGSREALEAARQLLDPIREP